MADSKIVNGTGQFAINNTDLTFIESQLMRYGQLIKVDHREYSCYSTSELLGLMRKYDFHQYTNNNALIDLLKFIIPDLSKTIEIGAGVNPIGSFLDGVKTTDLKVRVAKHPINIKIANKTATYKKLEQESMIMDIVIDSLDELKTLYDELEFIKYSYDVFKASYNESTKIMKFNSTIIEKEEQYYKLHKLAENKKITIDHIEQITGIEFVYLYFDSKDELKPFVESVLKQEYLNSIDEIIEKNSSNDKIIGLNLLTTTLVDDHYQYIVLEMLSNHLPLPKYLASVETIDATDAINLYRPETVISSWFTAKMKNEVLQNEAYDRTDLLSLYDNYKFNYITLGNKNIHSKLEILKVPHFEFYSKDILYSRVDESNFENNRLYIVPGSSWNRTGEQILEFAKQYNPSFHLELIN